MLVLSRKEGDRIRLYSGPLGTDSIEIVVTRFNHGQNCVGIGIDAPKAVVIERDDNGARRAYGHPRARELSFENR